MKVIALINCTGVEYEDFKKNEIRNLNKNVAKKLINFGYAKLIEEVANNSTEE